MNSTQPTLGAILRDFNTTTPQNWLATGAKTRHDLHGFIRYPAMMVPTMQADILDAIIGEVGSDLHVIDPFVGSGTVMTEAMRRGLHFTGIDINPLAILTCEAKAAIEAGVTLDKTVVDLLNDLKKDWSIEVDVSFHKIEKWFTPEQIIVFSQFRRAIMSVPEIQKRKCLWVAFAETVRSCSKSRTSTYKLHKRPDAEVISPEEVRATFETNLYNLLQRAEAYRKERGKRSENDPHPELICSDIHNAKFACRGNHNIIMTSPPYGDNKTTVPYGQFSYLALSWIPNEDLPQIPVQEWLANSAAIDTASLGGSLRDAEIKTRRVERLSPSMRAFFQEARDTGKIKQVRKVGAFLWDYYLAMKNVRKQTKGRSHWVITSGNRTSAGMTVPFDEACQDFVERLGGKRIETVHRQLPIKRMPSRNALGGLINSETTLVASFE